MHLGNRRLKCYECLTPRRASIVYDLSCVLRGQGVEMPECVGVQGNLVVSEWVDGRPLAEIAEAEKIELMAAYQATIHGAAIPARFKRHRAMPHARWLFARVRRFGGEAVDDARVVQLRDRLLRARPEGAPWGVLHPDFITTNLIVADRGVVSIDNEFLGVGHGQEWDILNTVKVSFPEQSRLQERYLNAYAKHRSLHTLMSHRNYWEAIYDIKMAGKRLSEGESDAGLRHLQAAAEKA